MQIDRDALISAGWTPPPDPVDYEAWRPALNLYQELLCGPAPASPLDKVDRDAIDVLKAVVGVSPTVADLAAKGRALLSALDRHSDDGVSWRIEQEERELRDLLAALP